ncbi:DUF285 domain-containing protein [Dyadobacter sp. CY347]|uniref:DUF285 domain-containing protein n=1 Tax=Dyadobacter sp. CY347 TaxID=2909336 RepID=UPI001F20EB9F|nr:DUF285 domain-containing protein [Dyadobacter sp. CY347]MCF2487715.1 DUF285 domain-containing protein [Dyadobacter sp. CY347]
MKILYILAFLFCLCAFQAKADFITYWKTGNPGVSAENQIIIPATGSNYYVYWIDVNDTDVSSEGLASGYHTLTFPYPGTFEVHILPFFGSFTRITFGPGSDAPKLIGITQWRDSQWANVENAFAGCTNLTITATYIPNTQNVISMAGMFRDAIIFDQPVNIARDRHIYRLPTAHFPCTHSQTS